MTTANCTCEGGYNTNSAGTACVPERVGWHQVDAGEAHNRRLQRAALPWCDDSCATANNGVCEARDAAVGVTNVAPRRE